MSDTVSLSAPAPVRDYYQVLTAGPEAFGDGSGLRELLSTHLDFTGSLAGHIPDATEGFLHGVAGFISTVRSITVIREVHDEHGRPSCMTLNCPVAPCDSPSSSPSREMSSTP